VESQQDFAHQCHSAVRRLMRLWIIAGQVLALKVVVGENYGSPNHYQRFYLVMLFDEERIGSGS
jgi:hypothetical protein